MRIGDVAKSADVGVETIRFYEQKGLIQQPLRPKSGGYRDYPSEIVRRIRFIRSAQHIGFSLNEIAELLELETGNNMQCVDIHQRAKAKRAEVQIRIDNLMRISAVLDRLIEQCPGCLWILEKHTDKTSVFKPPQDTAPRLDTGLRRDDVNEWA